MQTSSNLEVLLAYSLSHFPPNISIKRSEAKPSKLSTIRRPHKVKPESGIAFLVRYIVIRDSPINRASILDIAYAVSVIRIL